MTYALPAIGEDDWGQKILDSIEACHLIVSIAEYGAAVGNTAAANQTAIQNALNAVGAAGGGTVYVPPGTFLHNDAFTIPSNVHLRGSGVFSILKTTALASGGAGVGHRQIDATGSSNFQIRDLSFDASEMTVFTAGMRTIWLADSTRFSVRNCRFVTPGAATAAVRSSHFRITDNDITLSATDLAAHHDGIIDQWWGCHDFTIRGNHIDGAGYSKYPILVTGEDGTGAASGCYRFHIFGNTVVNTDRVGIWINGREGVNTDFTVSGNLVDGVNDNFGIAIADARRWAVAGNVTRNTGGNGIRVYQETSGGVGGITGGQDGTVTGNVVENANQLLSASGENGAAICVTDISGGITVTANRVKGSTHTYAVYFGGSTTNCHHGGGSYQTGTLGRVSGDPNNGNYTPVPVGVANVAAVSAATHRWTRHGDVIHVSGRLSVTPTAGASTVTTVGIPLPVASNLGSATNDLSGSGSTKTGVSCGISADVTNDRAELEFLSPGTTALLVPYSFSYTVL